MPPERPLGNGNPFFHRGPVRDPAYFIGRQAELSQSLQLAGNAQSISIVGPRRIGKTSLLFQIGARLQAAGTPAPFFTCEGYEHAEPELIYTRLGEELAEAERALGQRIELPQSGEPYHRLERLLRALCGGGQVAVILIDEFEALGRNPALSPHFFSTLRGLATRFQLSFITASQEPLIALTYSHPDILSSPFFNSFATLPLGLLADDEAHTLLRSLATKGGLAWSEATVDALVAWAGPQPFYLQLAGYHAFEAQRAGRPEATLAADASERAWPDLVPHFQYAWQGLSDGERYALVTLPCHPETAILEKLEAQCLVRRAGPHHCYLSLAWRQFVRRQHVPQVLQGDAILLDRPRRTVLVDEQPVRLTNTQFRVLAYLMARAGQPVSVRELEAAIWQDEYVEDPERVKAVIKHLRRALGPASRQIVNRRGLGYLYDPRPNGE